MAGTSDPYAAFRLNLEQQRKRAKDLIRAVRAGDRSASERIDRALDRRDADSPIKLADAQFAVARELGFASWRELRAHITALTAARQAMERTATPLDGRMPTLHIRCGSDIQQELARAHFTGDFLNMWDPFPVGPVTRAPNWIEERARFMAESIGDGQPSFEDVLDELTTAHARLAQSADRYTRVVLWMEHDSHDQLSLIRCLAHYARTHPPRVLELISVDRFPGTDRFIGLGQLPPEAMRLLWRRRVVVGAEQLQVAADAWAALTADDPRALAAVMRTGTPALPHLARALHRHLQELPSRRTGLGLTQSLTLEMLVDQPLTLHELWRTLQREREPLPFLGDTLFVRIVDEMGQVTTPVFERRVGDPTRPFRDQFTITDTGRAVLSGTVDWLSLQPPPRWVGGVRIDAADATWRWDEGRQDVVRAPSLLF